MTSYELTHQLSAEDQRERTSKSRIKIFLIIFVCFCCFGAIFRVFMLKNVPASPPIDLKNHENFRKFKKCGEVKIQNRVQFGNDSDPLEFTWMVAIFALKKQTQSVEFSCGGSLISEDLVVTAAHCLINTTEHEVSHILLGEQNFETDQDCINPENCADPVQNIKDFTTIIHPDYDFDRKTNDIALIKLKTPAKLTQNNIGTICLPFDLPEVPKRLQVIGFGRIEKGDEMSSKLKTAGMDFVENKQCVADYKEIDKIKVEIDEKTQFCAVGKAKVKGNEKAVDTCPGDSGSPVQSQSGNRMVQFGIVSHGSKTRCGKSKKPPGVYVKIYEYLNWILDNA